MTQTIVNFEVINSETNEGITFDETFEFDLNVFKPEFGVSVINDLNISIRVAIEETINGVIDRANQFLKDKNDSNISFLQPSTGQAN